MKDGDSETQEVRSYVRDRMSGDLPSNFVEDVMSDIHHTPQRRRQWIVRPLVAGIAAAAAGAVLVGIGLSMIDRDAVGGDPTPTPSVSASSEASAKPTPAVDPCGAVGPVPAERPPLSFPPLTDAGSRATVIVDRLRVHGFASCDLEVVAELGEGTEVWLTDGPLANGGLDWYLVMFSWLSGDPPNSPDFTIGWVAAGPAGQRPTSISIEPPRCPDTVTANVVGAMSNLARLQCLGTGPHEVTGVIHGCTDVFVSGEPAWLFTECLNLFNPDGTPSNLFIFFPPELDTAGLDPGDVVRLVGHVGDPAASECRALTDVSITALERAGLVLKCRSAFVLSEIEVTGYLELPY